MAKLMGDELGCHQQPSMSFMKYWIILKENHTINHLLVLVLLHMISYSYEVDKWMLGKTALKVLLGMFYYNSLPG